MSDLFDDFPHFNNLHTRTMALGLATHNETVYYLSTAGPGTSVKSVWSSLVSPNGTLDADDWGSDLKGVPGMRSEYKALAGSNFQHMVCFTRSSRLLVLTDPHAARFYAQTEIDHVEARKKRLTSQLATVYDTFVTRLNAQTDVPLLPGWAVPLFTAGLAEGAILPLETYGDCLGAWLLDEAFDWLPLVQRLLVTGQIKFTHAAKPTGVGERAS